MNKCKTCDIKCNKDKDNYKPERALQWLGVAVIAWCGIFMWWVLS